MSAEAATQDQGAPASSVAPRAAVQPAARSRRRWLIGGAALLAASALWFVGTRPLVQGALPGGSSEGPAKGVGPQVGYEAPNFTLKDPDGKRVELKQFRGKAVMLNFWATWCVPCKEELPEFEQVYRQHKDRGFVLLGVSLDSEVSAKDVPAYMKEGSPRVGSYTFPVALDTQQEVARTYKLSGIPATYFIDKEGVIRALHPGALNRQLLEERLKTIINVAA